MTFPRNAQLLLRYVGMYDVLFYDSFFKKCGKREEHTSNTFTLPLSFYVELEWAGGEGAGMARLGKKGM